MNWKRLDNLAQIESINQQSADRPILLFKHSTRCSISSMALNRLESDGAKLDGMDMDAYLLDLIAYRDVSNALADEYNIVHESPQVILVRNGKAVYDASHMNINSTAIMNEVVAVL